MVPSADLRGMGWESADSSSPCCNFPNPDLRKEATANYSALADICADDAIIQVISGTEDVLVSEYKENGSYPHTGITVC